MHTKVDRHALHCKYVSLPGVRHVQTANGVMTLTMVNTPLSRLQHSIETLESTMFGLNTYTHVTCFVPDFQ